MHDRRSDENLDWTAAKKHFDRVKKRYKALDSRAGVNVRIALQMTFAPLEKRYEEGERTKELHEAMMNVE